MPLGVDDALIWLAKIVGGEKLKELLNRKGLQAELRSLRKALQESQDRRAELESAAELVARIAQDRDQYFLDVVRLRQENARLRAAFDERN